MKESEMQITMQFLSYKELLDYKKRYFELKKAVAECADTQAVDACAGRDVRFDAKKALALCKDFLPAKYKSLNFIVDV